MDGQRTRLMAQQALHIALVANTAWNLHHFRGGLIQALQKAGHRVVAIGPPGGDGDYAALQKLGVTFVPLVHLSRKGINPIRDMLLCLELARIYRSHGLDLAMHYTVKCNIYGSMAARLSGIRSISTVTGLGYSFLRMGLVQAVVKLLYSMAFRRADLVYFQNPDDRAFFLERGLVQANRARMVPGSGIDPQIWAPRSDRKQLAESAPFRFLYVGRMLYDKGVRELIEAADLLVARGLNLIVDLIGEADNGNPAALSPDELQQPGKPHLRFHGPLSSLQDWYAAADAVVLPSYREGLPRVLLEALCMECPVVATRVAGCTELIRHGFTGILADPSSASDLADAMKQMMELPMERREQMGRAGRQLVVREFSEERVIGVYLGAISELFQKSRDLT